MIENATFVRGAVRVVDGGRYWEFAGVRRHVEDHDQVLAHLSDLDAVPARDLAEAMRRAEYLWGEVEVHAITDTPPDHDLEFAVLSPISFRLIENKLCMGLELYGDVIPEDELPTGRPATMLGPLLERSRMRLLSSEERVADSGPYWYTGLVLGFHLRGQTAGTLVRAGLEIAELLAAATGGLTRTTVADLIRSGHVQALLGQEESSWLEVKREHYPLRHLRGKVRLAGVVAQFANSPGGGIVVVGLETKTRNGVDVIEAVTPQPRDAAVRRRYNQVFKDHLFPPPEGLTIEVVEVSEPCEGELILIVVPDQPEELRPFLVHGAIVDGDAQGTFISIYRRGDEEAVATAPAAIHSTLAAGRGLLRRGQLPPS